MLIRLTTIALGVALVGCSTQPSLYQKSKDQTAAYIERHRDENARASTVTETDRPYVKAVAVEHRPALRGGVSLNLTAAPLSSAVQSVAEQNGYDVAFIGKTDPNKAITVSLTNQPFEHAIKELAFAAGYVAVIDDRFRKVSISDRATYTFRVDPQSLEGREDSYTTSSNPSGGTTGGSSSQSGQSGSSGSTPSGATSTSVKVGSTGTGGADEFVNAIRKMVGASEKSPEVQYVSTTGLLTVQGNAAELRRVTDFVEHFLRDSLTQVELEAAIIEVQLGDDFQYGIDWSHVIPLSGPLAGAQAAISVSNRGIVTNPGVTATITSSSVSSVIQALREKTNVTVVAEPRVTSLNHRDGIYLRATQKPYLPEIQGTAVPNAGTTTSGKVAFVPDGISFAFRPAVMSSNVVRVRLLPVITAVGARETFQIGAGQANAYNVVVSQSHLEVELEAGKTSIVNGLSLDRNSNLDSAVPGVGDIPLLGSLMTTKTRNGQKTQTVMLLTARIIPPPSGLNPIVGESL